MLERRRSKGRGPDYCKKETPARRLDLEIGAADQYVKRGLPVTSQSWGSFVFCWQEVDSYLRGGNTAESEHVDPTTPEHAVPPKLLPHVVQVRNKVGRPYLYLMKYRARRGPRRPLGYRRPATA